MYMYYYIYGLGMNFSHFTKMSKLATFLRFENGMWEVWIGKVSTTLMTSTLQYVRIRTVKSWKTTDSGCCLGSGLEGNCLKSRLVRVSDVHYTVPGIHNSVSRINCNKVVTSSSEAAFFRPKVRVATAAGRPLKTEMMWAKLSIDFRRKLSLDRK